MASFRKRLLKRTFIGFILINVLVSNFFTGEKIFGLQNGSLKEKENSVVLKQKNLNSSKFRIQDIIEPQLLNDVNNLKNSTELKLLIEVEKGFLNQCLDLFELYGSINNTFNYRYYTGFSAEINSSAFQNYLLDKPNHIKLIKYERIAEFTLRNTLQQLRINPYIRQKYGLRGDKHSSIAVLDSGVDASHPAFQGKNITYVVNGEVEEIEAPTDERGHGTGVAGVACAEPYKTIDEKNRTIITENYYYDWNSVPDASLNYRYVSNSFIAQTNGTIQINGNWFAESGSTINNVFAFDLVNSSGKIVQTVEISQENKQYNLSYNINQSNFGVYSVQHRFNVSSDENPTYGINITILLPENQSTIEQYYQGVAPNCKLIALKCAGYNWGEPEIKNAMHWVLDNKEDYNITTVIMSFKINSYEVRNLADQMIENGIFVAAAAGNDGPSKNWAGSIENAPGCADKVMSVGATSYNFSLTEYSSQGGPSTTGDVIKPDIVAFGGSKYDYKYMNNPSMYVPDSNNGEYLGELENVPDQFESLGDMIENDSYAVAGTSYAAPLVGGGAQLIIEALGGLNNWNYTEKNALFIKNLLLLTATETNPNNRLYFPDWSPELNRGGKDIHEGYGKINIDAAIDALNNTFEINSTISGTLSSIPTGQLKEPYCWARSIYLPRNYYNITLEVPEDADFDLYIYDYQGNEFGEPIIKGKGINETRGADEILIDFPSHKAQKYFIVVKGINGTGQFNLSLYKSPSYYDKINPACQLNLPVNDQSSFNGSIFIKGNASDNFNLQKAEIIIQSPKRTISIPVLLGNISITEFNATWISKKIDNGNCSIYATIYDDFNNTAQSNIINITIFNDDVPPTILFISPKDGESITGIVKIYAKLEDVHNSVKNATLFIENESSTIYTYFLNGSGPFVLEWTPSSKDIGNRFIYIEAFDTKDNLGRSDVIFIAIQKSYALRNTLIIFSLLSIVMVLILNKPAKKLLINEKLMDYFENISDFIKSPSRKKIKRIHPKKILNIKKNMLNKQLDKIQKLINEKKYRKAFLFSKIILQRLESYNANERKKGEIKIILEDLISELKRKL